MNEHKGKKLLIWDDRTYKLICHGDQYDEKRFVVARKIFVRAPEHNVRILRFFFIGSRKNIASHDQININDFIISGHNVA